MTHETAVSQGPLVSIVMCAHNAGSFLRPAVHSALSQTYANVELLVVDDGSTDASIASLDPGDSRLRVIRQPQSGKPAALNRALEELRGEFYAIQDADDLSHPWRIERQATFLMANTDVAAVFCGHELLLDGREVAPRFRTKDRQACRQDIEAFRMPAHDPTAMYRVASVAGLRYEPALSIGQGFDYVLRVGEQWPMFVLGECLYGYRVHPASATKRDPATRARFVAEVLRRARERRGVPHQADPDWGWLGRPDNNIAADFMESVVDLRASGRWLEAIRTGFRCVRLQPGDLHYYKALLYAFLPTAIRQMLRKSERNAEYVAASA